MNKGSKLGGNSHKKVKLGEGMPGKMKKGNSAFNHNHGTIKGNVVLPEGKYVGKSRTYLPDSSKD